MERFGLHCCGGGCSWAALRQSGLKSTQMFVLATIVFLTLFVTVLCIGFLVRYETETEVINADSISYWREQLPSEQKRWFNLGIDELELAMKRNLRRRYPRNVVVFIIDGIGRDAIAAARYLNVSVSKAAKGKLTKLSWDTFEQLGKLKNSCSNTDVCDGFTVGTALFGGVPTAFQLGGVDAGVGFRNCTAAASAEHRVSSVLAQALTAGMRAGFVTTRRVTSPLMAALYAHTPDTSWECDATIPKGLAAAGCIDVARQLLELNAHVVMGGGRQTLVSRVAKSAEDPIDERVCQSQDGRNLIRDWQLQRLEQRQRFTVLHNSEELHNLNGSNVDHVLGIFSNGDLQRLDASERVPLQQMVRKALQVLKRRESGYLLFVHSGIDVHATLTEQAQKVLQLNTLLGSQAAAVATSDTLTLLLFTRGRYVRRVPDTSVETELLTGLHDAVGDDELLDARYTDMLTDTLIYARGPQSQLFSGVHEETYLAHAIAYALRIGHFAPQQ